MDRNECFSNISIIDSIQSTEKFSAIEEIITKTPFFNEIPHLDSLKKDAVDREKISCTGFGHGVAVAHGKSEDVSSVKISLGISRKGIQYDSYDGKPVHLLFFLANSGNSCNACNDYLQALSSVVKVVKENSFRQKLLSCRSKKAIKKELINALLSLN